MQLKKVLVCFAISCSTLSVFAQDKTNTPEPVEKFFKLENLFTGGNVSVGFGNGQFSAGAIPHFGYKLTNWVDAGVVFNFAYNGVRDYYEFGDKVKQFTYGPGVFTRLYPVDFLFVQGQFEHNFSNLNYKPAAGSTSFIGETIKSDVSSLLLGAGYAQGRQGGSNTFFYISLLFDVLKNPNSPYVNISLDPNNTNNRRVTMAPIIRAGFNIGLFQNRYGRY
jgi:hypothetical protein